MRRGRAAAPRSLGPGFLVHPVQVRRRASDDRRRHDLGLVVAVPLGEEVGELLIAVGRQLEYHQPLLGTLEAVLPPVGTRDRPGDLPDRSEPCRHRVMGEFYRLGARIGRRLDLEIARVGVGCVALTRHGNRSYAGRGRVDGGCGLSCQSAITPGQAAEVPMGERDGRFCLVVNPAAGRGRSLRGLPEGPAVLDAAGVSYQVSESASLADAAAIAARAAGMGQVVVAVGGDGLAGALSGVAATGGARYGLTPPGEGSAPAGVLGPRPGPAAAAAVLIAGEERRVDLIGVATPGQPETVVAGSVYVGIPSVAGEIANRTRWLRGPIVYSVAALRALAGWAPTAFRVEIRRSDRPEEGGALVRDFAGYAVVVANAAYFGAGMRVAPPAQLDDGMLVTMRHGPRLAFIRTLLRVRNGSHTGLAQISLDRGTEVTGTVGRDLPAAADGETLPCAAPLQPGTPLHIRALPRALRALVPPPPRAGPAGSAR